jgi:hypothetical protein
MKKDFTKGSEAQALINNNTELAIFALGQVHCSMAISVLKLGVLKILPPIFSTF